MRYSIPLLIFASFAVLSGCDAATQCQQHYSAGPEIAACIEGSQKGNALFATYAVVPGFEPGAAIASMRNTCERQCEDQYPVYRHDPGQLRIRKACTDSCQATAIYLINNNSNGSLAR